jgi:Protein of unknown function (DUF3455)
MKMAVGKVAAGKIAARQIVAGRILAGRRLAGRRPASLAIEFAISIQFSISIQALPAQQAGGSIDLPASAQVVLEATGDGVQIYTCAAAPGGVRWVLTAPDAQLLDASGKPIGRHFAGPTWKLEEGSEVKGELIASQPAPEAGSVAWLLLRAKAGTGTGSLAAVAFIRRTKTHGGVAPAAGCATPADAGKTVRVPYTATYSFYSDSTAR